MRKQNPEYRAYIRLTTSVFIWASLLLLPEGARAQETDRSVTGQLEEVVVTVRRHEEALQRVPVSVTAFSGAELQQQSVVTVSDLQGQIPGLFIQEAFDDPQSITITMRGRKQGDITLAVDPSASLNVDGVYIPRTLGMGGSLLDIKRVEVLRGPQGTLYGRNSTAGAMGLFTNDPTDELFGSVAVTGGNYDAWNVVGIANTPITDSLGARFVAQRGGHGGYEHNATGTPLEDASSEYYRGKLRWKGDNGWSGVLSSHYESEHSGKVRVYESGLVPAANGDPEGGALALETAADAGLSLPQAVALLESLVANRNSYLVNNTGGAAGGGNMKRWDAALNVTGNLSETMEFRSITDFQHLHRDVLFGTQQPATVIISTFDTSDRYLSQEFQILGTTPRFNWVVGLYGGVENGKQTQVVVLLPNVLGPVPGTNDNRIYNSSVAGFAQATWEFVPTWRLTAGARYTSDTRRIDAIALNGTQCVVPAPGVESTDSGAAQCPRRFKNAFSKPTWIASLDHQLTPDVLLYAKVATGYRSGGLNEGGAVQAETFAPFAPETNVEYEVGLKSEFFDRKLRLNVDAYQDKYSNLQVQTVSVAGDGSFVSFQGNAATSTVKGVEAEAVAIVAPGFTVRASGTFTDAHYDKFTDATGDRSNEAFSVPKWAGALSAKYVRPTGAGDLLTELDYDWRSAVNLQGHAALASQVTQPQYGLLNARIDLHLDAHNLDVALFGKNITNVQYSDQAVSLEQAGFNRLYKAAPATFGIEITEKFGK